MNDSSDAVLLRRQRQFLHEVEQGIRECNRDIIHGRIPELNKQSFTRFAAVVARLRAAYLEAALGVSREADAGEALAESVRSLRDRREAYEEARDAFEALQRAIERGYVDIAGAGEPPVALVR
jgi:hypothetical protein